MTLVPDRRSKSTLRTKPTYECAGVRVHVYLAKMSLTATDN